MAGKPGVPQSLFNDLTRQALQRSNDEDWQAREGDEGPGNYISSDSAVGPLEKQFHFVDGVDDERVNDLENMEDEEIGGGGGRRRRKRRGEGGGGGRGGEGDTDNMSKHDSERVGHAVVCGAYNSSLPFAHEHKR